MSELDDLDREQREWRREQLKRWTRTQQLELKRARAVLGDPGATPEQKHEARILIGAYAISPGLMAAGGHDFAGANTPLERHNRHSRTPPPPRRHRNVLASLRAALRGTDTAQPVTTQTTWPATASVGFELPIPPSDTPTPAPVPVDGPVRDPDAPPDLAEEILGWKVLAFGGDGFLQRDCDDAPLLAVPRELSSPTKSARWPDSGWLVATCARNPEHEPPVESCGCGIYAVAEVEAARPYIWEAPLTVLARVGLAGKVIPGSRGWRAERARVVALTRTGAGPRDYPRMLARVANHYAVPILDLDFLDPRPATSPET